MIVTLFSTRVFDCNFETFCSCKFISCVLKSEYILLNWNWIELVGCLSWRYLQQLFCQINYYLNLHFFQLLQSVPLKNEKDLLEKDASHLKIVWHSMRQSKTLKKQQEKRIIGKSETTTIIIYYILFYTEKFIFC